MKYSLIHNALTMIPPALRKNGVFIIMLLILSSFLDFFSIASFLPVLILIIKPEVISSGSLISEIEQMSGLVDKNYFTIALTLGAVTFIVIKTEINSRISYKKALYGYHVARLIAADMLSQHFESSYEAFINKDYAREMNRISNLPLTFANNFIVPTGTIISESLIALLLSSIICYFDSGLFFLILLIGALCLILFRLKRSLIQSISKQIKTIYPKVIKYSLQTIEGYVETKVFRKENFFKKRFTETYETLGNTLAKDHALNTGTSRTTELIVAVCISVLIIYTLLSGKSSSESILLLSVYAGASFRIIPSINRVFAAFMQMKTHEYVIEELTATKYSEKVTSDDEVSAMSFNEKLELRNIGFRYNGKALVFKNCSLSINKGEKIIISGKSGSGKTTLLLLLMRLLKEQEGDICLDGRKISNSNSLAYQQLFGYVSQNPYILDASISENIAFGTDLVKINFDKVNRIIKDLNLLSLINNLPAGLNTNIGEKGIKISGGQRQRLAIARALYHDSQILLLDEITNQLDHQTEWEVMQALKNVSDVNKTIILVTHRPDIWTWFDSYYELKEGLLEKAKSAIMQDK